MANFERKKRRIKDGRAPRVVLKTINPGVSEIRLFMSARVGAIVFSPIPFIPRVPGSYFSVFSVLCLEKRKKKAKSRKEKKNRGDKVLKT